MMLGLGAERGGRPMLRHHHAGAWHTTSWAQFATTTAALAQSLRPHLAPADRVLLVSDSRPEVPMANVALQAIGAIPVPAYPSNSPADHAHLLADSGARVAIVATAALARRVLAGAGLAQGLDRLICMEPFEGATPWHDLTTATDALPAITAAAAAIGRNATAVLMYTSGTGGAPKGVVLSHRAILSNCIGAAAVVTPLRLSDETYLSILPLSHSYEYTVGQYFLSALGLEVIYARGVEHLAADLRALRPHVITVVPRVLEVIRARILAEVARMPAWRKTFFARALANGERRLDRALTLSDRLTDPPLDHLVRQKIRDRFGGRIVAIVSGGARLDPATGRFFAAMGLRVMQGYGQTEAGPVISVNPPDAVRVETVGPPLAGVDLRIAEDGEILVRGDLVMDGYWNRPADTAETITDGWLHTGDLGEMNAGYLRITDRKKDILVLSGGENISPARIEALLMDQPEIAQAVVTGDGKPALAALLVAAERATEPDLAAAVQRVNATLSGPEKIRRHTAVPPFTLDNGLLTATQKIRRRLVIARHSASPSP